MQGVLIWTARLAGIAGVLAMLLAVLVRLSGDYWLAGFQVGTILQAGMAVTLVGWLGYTAALVERTKP
jgi:hypothetical protein